MRRLVVLLAIAFSIAAGCESGDRFDPVAAELKLKRLQDDRAEVEAAYGDLLRLNGKFTDDERAEYKEKTERLDRQISDLRKRLK